MQHSLNVKKMLLKCFDYNIITDFDERHGELVGVAFERSYLLQNPYFDYLSFENPKFTHLPYSPQSSLAEHFSHSLHNLGSSLHLQILQANIRD